VTVPAKHPVREHEWRPIFAHVSIIGAEDKIHQCAHCDAVRHIHTHPAATCYEVVFIGGSVALLDEQCPALPVPPEAA